MTPVVKKVPVQKKGESSSVAGGLRNELQLRAKWVLIDKEKFTVLTQDLKEYNDGLGQHYNEHVSPEILCHSVPDLRVTIQLTSCL